MAESNNLALDKDKVKDAFDLSNFDINAVLRGAQLTLVGGTFLSLVHCYLRFHLYVYLNPCPETYMIRYSP